MTVEFLEQENNVNAPLKRAQDRSYSEVVRWLVDKRWFKQEISAKLFLVSISFLILAISCGLMYVGYLYENQNVDGAFQSSL